MTLYIYLLLAAGGAVGTMLRYAFSVWTLPISHHLPWGTMLINIIGSFVIGFFGTLTLMSGKFPVSENIRLLVMVGLLGGFTTFSAFSLQTFELIRNGLFGRALINAVFSVTLCVCAVAVGHFLAARMNSGAVQVAQIELEENA